MVIDLAVTVKHSITNSKFVNKPCSYLLWVEKLSFAKDYNAWLVIHLLISYQIVHTKKLNSSVKLISCTFVELIVNYVLP